MVNLAIINFKGFCAHIYLHMERNHLLASNSSSGRKYSDLFMDLPSKKEYPEYYETIENPTSFNMISVSHLFWDMI